MPSQMRVGDVARGVVRYGRFSVRPICPQCKHFRAADAASCPHCEITFDEICSGHLQVTSRG